MDQCQGKPEVFLTSFAILPFPEQISKWSIFTNIPLETKRLWFSKNQWWPKQYGSCSWYQKCVLLESRRSLKDFWSCSVNKGVHSWAIYFASSSQRHPQQKGYMQQAQGVAETTKLQKHQLEEQGGHWWSESTCLLLYLWVYIFSLLTIWRNSETKWKQSLNLAWWVFSVDVLAVLGSLMHTFQLPQFN